MKLNNSAKELDSKLLIQRQKDIEMFEKIIDEWMFEREKNSNSIDFAVVGYKDIKELKQKLKELK